MSKVKGKKVKLGESKLPFMRQTKLWALVFIVAITGCNEPNKTLQKQWYKGNLHTHSYWSDGDEFPEMIMDWYKSRDYQFVALTDHNTLAEGEKWKTIPEDTVYQEGFRKYLEKYGEEWVRYRSDSLGRTEVQLKTYESYRGLFEEKEKFLILQSEEITDQFEQKPVHMNATNVQHKIDPQGGSSVLEVMQNNIDAVEQQSQELGEPMHTIINHPNFFYSISLQDLIALRNGRFFELYNGHHMVNNLGDSSHLSTERMWDLINVAYIQDGKPLMYGLATDDSHHYHQTGAKWSNAGRGWIHVRADSLSPGAILSAMESGDFYASTGVVLRDLEIQSNRLSVAVEAEPGVGYKITFIGCKKGETDARVLHSVEGEKATFDLTEDLLFVRCKIISSKLQENPIETFVYEMAWTQPIQPK